MSLYKDWDTEKKYMIIKALMTGDCYHMQDAWDELGFKNEPMAVVFAESYDSGGASPESFHKLMIYGGSDPEHIYCFREGDREILLLIGRKALDRLGSIIYHFKYHNPQGSSPLGRFFITYGQTAKTPAGLAESYSIASILMEGRFYYRDDEHICGPERMPAEQEESLRTDASEYINTLMGPLSAANKPLIQEKLKAMEDALFKARMRPDEARAFIVRVYAGISIEFWKNYKEAELMPGKDTVTKLLSSRSLSAAMDILERALFSLLKVFGEPAGGSIIEDMIAYVERSFHMDMKLENIAPEFGYNSAYLGRIFKENTGETFGAYVEKVRMQKACELLKETDLKVYEIAERVGYKNVDYFHIKFRRNVGMSPAEYRK
ncbi:MAG: helix-turn-helix domain-containing protein [Lachnospiraceae bacterium]|nr:helix-turn-helix domain-containing protein [Lachnospiraceae bacterium]